VNTKNLTNYT